MTKPITDRPLMKAGRKPKAAPGDALQRIETMAADGFSKIGVAAGLGVDIEVLRRWLDEAPELQDAFDRGRERERHALHNMLYRQAMEKGNATAAMFLLKSRHGYREGDQVESANRVSINFQLPAAMPLADFKVIEHGKSDDRVEPISTARALPAGRD